MGTGLSSEEIIRKAEEIERKVAKFYRDAAQRALSEDIRCMLMDLAAMDEGHLQMSEHMRRDLSARKPDAVVAGPNDNAASYVQVVVDSFIGEEPGIPIEDLTGNESMEDEMRMAIEAESRSILLYVGLQNLICSEAETDALQAIIKEEMSHVVSLNLSLAMLK